ncbi:MAG: hypothetical protein ACI92A_000341, partial [Candidatus Paceibacteria bacterium]
MLTSSDQWGTMMSDQKNHLPNAYKIENTEQA